MAIKRLIQSLWSFLVDLAINHYPTVLSVVFGTGMIYLASISKWLEPYGPVAWGGVGIISVFLLSLAFYWAGWARRHFAIASYAENKGKNSSVNTLSPTHTHERINLGDFYHPYLEPTSQVRFQDCHIYGPALVAMFGAGYLSGVKLPDCDVVILSDEQMRGKSRPPLGAVLFVGCTFINCSFYRVTFLLPQAEYEGNPAWKTLPVVSGNIKPKDATG